MQKEGLTQTHLLVITANRTQENTVQVTLKGQGVSPPWTSSTAQPEGSHHWSHLGDVSLGVSSSSAPRVKIGVGGAGTRGGFQLLSTDSQGVCSPFG